MHEGRFVLRPKSAAWRSSDPPVLSEVSLTVERDGVPLGGNNVQVILGAPDQPRSGLNEDVLLWLEPGWWVTVRNQFAAAPTVAAAILASAAQDLSRLTEYVGGGEGGESTGFWELVVCTTIAARGPDYWR
jgi:hypothetical protein